MNIPEKVKIGGHIYTINNVKGFELDGCGADINVATQIIRICQDSPQDRRESSFLHEIIEAIDSNFELKLEHPIIQCLEETLYQVIVDNPDIFKESEPNG
jgi:hypothetical protein